METNNCINCEKFAWWEKDYCCLAKMIILQHSPKGDFTEDILKTIKTDDECNDYEHANNLMAEMYKEIFDNFMKKRTPHD